MSFFDEYAEFLSCAALSDGSVSAYLADIRELYRYADDREEAVVYADEPYLREYFDTLRRDGASDATLRRALSSLRRFYGYWVAKGVLQTDPSKAVRISLPKRESIAPLSPQEIDRLLSAPDGNDPKAVRDRAMLELLYASAISVSELISLQVDDYFPTGLLSVRGGRCRRPIRLYARVCERLDRYLVVRRSFLPSAGETAMFLNTSGGRLSRQGIWKLLREYGEKANISQTVTPKLVRASLVAHLVDNGMPIEQLQPLLGHRNRAATEAFLASLATEKEPEISTLVSYHPHARDN